MLSSAHLAEAGTESAIGRAGGCMQPVRLKGRSMLVDTATGELRETWSSDRELDGHVYVRCRNRRAAVCPSCSREYKGDAWHLLVCGLAGGKGIPAAVAERPATFVTLTAPSFGAVHGVRGRGPCRMRRDQPVCEHGRPAWCGKRHRGSDPQLGQPLCFECYDYTAHVLWQWHAPELWRRFRISLERKLAQKVGVTVARFREACRVHYAKVVEFQARGLIHVHAPIRLDGPGGPDGSPTTLPITVTDLEDAVRLAAAGVAYDTPPMRDGRSVQLRWGDQLDCRTIRGDVDRDSNGALAHPEQVAAYLAKYLTKTTEEFGLPAKVGSVADAREAGASPHAMRILRTAVRLSREGESYERLRKCLATLGFRGHPITKSRGYSVTFGQLRRSRRVFRRNPGLAVDCDVRRLLDDVDVPEGFERVTDWTYVGRGYLDLDQAADAVRAAALSRTRNQGDYSPAASR